MSEPQNAQLESTRAIPLQSSHSSWGVLLEALRVLASAADCYARKRLIAALSFVAVLALLSALTPISLKLAVDSLSDINSATALAVPTALVFAYIVGQYLVRALGELRFLAHGQAEQRLRREIGRRLFDHLVHLPFRFHLERRTGAIGETIEQGLRGYQLLLTHIVYTVLPAVVEFVAVAVVLVHLGHPTYLAILCATAVSYFVIMRRGASSIQEPARSVTASQIDAHAILTDSLLNCETIKCFGAEPVVCSRFDIALGATESAWRQFYRRRAANGLLVATIFGACLCASLLCATHEVVNGDLTVGDFVLVNAYVMRLAQPLEQLGFAARDISQGLANLEKMLVLLWERREESISNQPISPGSEMKGELVFENVSFSYAQDIAVLKNISFRVPAGRTVAVVGSSGSGKSSLVRLVFRLFEPDHGRILIDGIPVTTTPLLSLRQMLAVVPQDTHLFNATIAANIGIGKQGSGFFEIQAAARIAHLHEAILSMPDGYDTMVGERGLKLSGGERQRVAIARAVLKRPRILVFDEVTSSLDSRTEKEVLRSITDAAGQATTLVIAHRLSTVVNADEILVLDRGEIVERGTHRSLLERHGQYASLWRAQYDRDAYRSESSVA